MWLVVLCCAGDLRQQWRRRTEYKDGHFLPLCKNKRTWSVFLSDASSKHTWEQHQLFSAQRKNTMWTYDANLEAVGFMTYTSACHHGAINMFWLHFKELPCCPSLHTELGGPIGQSDKSPAGVSNELFSDFLVFIVQLYNQTDRCEHKLFSKTFLVISDMENPEKLSSQCRKTSNPLTFPR